METIEVLNARLIEHFGVEWNGQPIWQIVFSDDQFEKQLSEYTPNGIHLIMPEMQLLPKYTYIKHKYVLEKLGIVPIANQKELTTKLSYEPIWTFEDKFGNPLPPLWEACKFVIDTVLAATGKESLGPKYVDPLIDQPIEKQAEQIIKLEQELFGNETDVTDALAHGYGVTVPSNYKDEN